MSAWPLVSRVGESALLMPCALVVFAWLQSGRAPHDRANAVRWALTLGCAVALVVASKLAYMGWGIGGRAFDFTGISGHSTMAAAVLPVLARLLVPERHRAMAVVAVAVSVAVAIVVGVSRLALEVHSPAEVVAGLALGFGASATFLVMVGPAAARRAARGGGRRAAAGAGGAASVGEPADAWHARAHRQPSRRAGGALPARRMARWAGWARQA